MRRLLPGVPDGPSAWGDPECGCTRCGEARAAAARRFFFGACLMSDGGPSPAWAAHAADNAWRAIGLATNGPKAR